MATATPSPTPNPNAMKFTVDTTFDDAVNVSDPDAAIGHPWAEPLFAIAGVISVFATADFVTVSKSDDGDWDAITPQVVEVLAERL